MVDFRFLNPGYLGPRQFFQRRFAMPIEKYMRLVANTAIARSALFCCVVSKLIAKSFKTCQQEMAVFCGLSTEQAELYQRVVEESLVEIESAEGLQTSGDDFGYL